MTLHLQCMEQDSLARNQTAASRKVAYRFGGMSI